MRLARTLVRSDSDAEEIAQRTFASALHTPPKHGGLRAWLARVTRNHATELHRVERRRTDRERVVARNEAVDAGASAMERLELEHGVVRAVLALDEPYRSVVVQTYYEGMTPAEIAKQRGVPAGTVRSQLTRAHEMLRGKLDREHGERGTWMSALTGLLSLRDVQVAPVAPLAPAVSSAPTSLAWPIAIGAGVAACIATVLVVRAVGAKDDTETGRIESVTIGSAANTLMPAVPALAPVALARSREPIGGPNSQALEGVDGFVPADDPVELLEQSRQIKTLILERRLAVTPEERERARIPVDSETTGVVRLLDRTEFGERYTLPWMRGGGSYFSFTERVHDYNRRPQIMLDSRFLSADYSGSSRSIALDLGERRLADVPASGAAPSWLDSAERFVWDLAHSNLEGTDWNLFQFGTTRLHDALENGVLNEQSAAAVKDMLRPVTEAFVGHSYLVRSTSSNEFDVLVAIEVVELSDEQCTLGWRMLNSRPIANPDPLRVPTMEREKLPDPPDVLANMSEEELMPTLGAVRTRVDEVLFLGFSPEIEARFGAWRAHADSGLIRLTPYLSEWTELSSRRNGGAIYSFDERSHDAQHYDLYIQENRLEIASSGYHCGAIVDLGMLAIESTSVATIESIAGPLGTLLTQHEFPVHEFDTNPRTRDRAAREALGASERADSQAFVQARNALNGTDSAAVAVGHTYALRSVVFGAHDVLVAVYVAARDEQGVVLAWKLLQSRPVTPRD